MSLSRGVVYIAIGAKAKAELRYSMIEIRRSNPGLETKVIDAPTEGMTDMQASRWAKLNMPHLSKFDLTAYLDADTRPQGDLSAGFEMLEDGWDLVIAPSANQGEECLWHVRQDEREELFSRLGFVPLQLQAGVFFFRKTQAVTQLFAAWREEWKRYRDHDQGALLRALYRRPVKTWILGRPWNGGAVVQHLSGRCR